MTSLWIPPNVARELQERTRSFNAAVLESIELDDTDPYLLEYTIKLQAIDPGLLMVRARGTVVPGVPMRPGYYHVLRRNEGAPWSITPIEGEHGEFTVPTGRVFDRLAAGDMTERRSRDDMIAVHAAEQATEARERAREREQRQDHLRGLVRAYTQASVSSTDATPWRQNQAGHRRGG